MITYPSDMQLVNEVIRYNKKKAKGKAIVAVADGDVTISSQTYDDDEDVFTDEDRLKVSKANIRNARDRFAGYAALLQAFLDEIKDL